MDAQMAESVDALVSNTSRFTPVPVRPRLWVQEEKNESSSLFFVTGRIVHSEVHCVMWDDETMGHWDYGTMRNYKSRAKRTIPFRFHFSVFTFISRRRHLTFEAKLRNASTLLRLGIVNTFTLLSP